MDAGAPDKWEYDYTFMIIGVVFMTLGITTNVVFFFCGISFLILGMVAFNDKKETENTDSNNDNASQLTLEKKPHDEVKE